VQIDETQTFGVHFVLTEKEICEVDEALNKSVDVADVRRPGPRDSCSDLLLSLGKSRPGESRLSGCELHARRREAYADDARLVPPIRRGIARVEADVYCFARAQV